MLVAFVCLSLEQYYFLPSLIGFILCFAVWRARKFMLRQLANPIPAAATRENVYYVPAAPQCQHQVPMYGIGGAFPSAPTNNSISTEYLRGLYGLSRKKSEWETEI